MTDQRKLNIVFYIGGLIATCAVLLYFQTSIVMVGGLFLGAILGITHGFTEKPIVGLVTVLALSVLVFGLGFFWAIAPGNQFNFNMLLFGFGGILGSIYTLMLDDVSNSVGNYLYR